MRTSGSPQARKGVSLTIIVAWMVAAQALVVWVFAGVLFPGML